MLLVQFLSQFIFHYYSISFLDAHGLYQKTLLKALSGVRFCAPLKSTICLLLSICLMSWKITCIQKAAVGVRLIHYCGEKWFTIARFKGSAAIRAKLTSLLKTPSYQPHQRAFRNCLPSFRGRLVRGGVLDQRFTEVKIKHFIISQGRGEVNNAVSVLSTVLFWSLRKNTFILSVLLCETKVSICRTVR